MHRLPLTLKLFVALSLSATVTVHGLIFPTTALFHSHSRSSHVYCVSVNAHPMCRQTSQVCTSASPPVEKVEDGEGNRDGDRKKDEDEGKDDDGERHKDEDKEEDDNKERDGNKGEDEDKEEDEDKYREDKKENDEHEDENGEGAPPSVREECINMSERCENAKKQCEVGGPSLWGWPSPMTLIDELPLRSTMEHALGFPHIILKK